MGKHDKNQLKLKSPKRNYWRSCDGGIEKKKTGAKLSENRLTVEFLTGCVKSEFAQKGLEKVEVDDKYQDRDLKGNLLRSLPEGAQQQICQTDFPIFQEPPTFFKQSKSLFNELLTWQDKTVTPTKTSKYLNDYQQAVASSIQHLRLDSTESSHQKIIGAIGTVNRSLFRPPDTKMMEACNESRRENMDYDVPDMLFNSREWKYATPPSQKFQLTFYEERKPQPAVLCTNNCGRQIFELKADVNPNLINHIDVANVTIDKRYMRPINDYDEDSGKENSDQMNMPPFMKDRLEELAMTVHCRPKKILNQNRISGTVSCKRVLRGMQTIGAEPVDPFDVTFTSMSDELNNASPKCYKIAKKVNLFHDDQFPTFNLGD